MYSDGHPTEILTKWESISVVDPFEVPAQSIKQSHSGMPPFGEENGRLLLPAALSVATAVRRLWYLFWNRVYPAIGGLESCFRRRIASGQALELTSTQTLPCAGWRVK
jgi:hypothetical protein